MCESVPSALPLSSPLFPSLLPLFYLLTITLSSLVYFLVFGQLFVFLLLLFHLDHFFCFLFSHFFLFSLLPPFWIFSDFSFCSHLLKVLQRSLLALIEWHNGAVAELPFCFVDAVGSVGKKRKEETQERSSEDDNSVESKWVGGGRRETASVYVCVCMQIRSIKSEYDTKALVHIGGERSKRRGEERRETIAKEEHQRWHERERKEEKRREKGGRKREERER